MKPESGELSRKKVLFFLSAQHGVCATKEMQ